MTKPTASGGGRRPTGARPRDEGTSSPELSRSPAPEREPRVLDRAPHTPPPTTAEPQKPGTRMTRPGRDPEPIRTAYQRPDEPVEAPTARPCRSCDNEALLPDPEPIAHRGPLLRERAVDHPVSVHAGLTILHSGYKAAGGGFADPYHDPGLGLLVRYRPVPAFAVEGGFIRYDEWAEPDSQRDQLAMQGSALLFPFPKAPVSPYVTAGLTANDRSVADLFTDGERERLFVTERAAVGPHLGLGIEIPIGARVTLDFEGKLIGYANHRSFDPSLPGAIATTGAIGFAF